MEAFLTVYRAAEDAGEIPLEGEAALELDAEVRTIDAQLRSPKPKRRVVKASVREVGHLLRGAGGSALFQGAMKVAEAIL